MIAFADEVEAGAIAMLRRYPLLSADALQLASALVAAGARVPGSVFVTRDAVLATRLWPRASA